MVGTREHVRNITRLHPEIRIPGDEERGHGDGEEYLC